MLDISRMKAPGDTRPTWRNGVIQIHITRACDLSCVSCTQGSNLAGKPVMITLENFEIACESLKDYYGVIGIFGGNPTLHPKFKEICAILQRIIPFEQRGLWSNNLNGYGELCRETFNPKYSNLNVHGIRERYDEMKRDWPESVVIGLRDSRHSPPFVAMKDIDDLPYEEQCRLIENCDINQFWSAMVCQFRGELRGYFCELAGAQSMLHENEADYPDTGLRVYKDIAWWKFPIHQFDNQIKKHCFECGVPLRGKGDLSQGNNEFVSKTHEKVYKLKSPKGKNLKLVNNLDGLQGTVKRSTDYILNGVTSVTKVLVALPTGEYARRADFYDFYNALIKPEGTLLCSSHGQSPARNRNIMIREAIKNDCTHILFLDDDMALPSNLLIKLLEHDKDMVTGLYLMRNYPHYPIIFDIAYKDGRCKFSFLNPGRKGLVKVINAGLGCCLIKTSVFKGMLEKGVAWIDVNNLETWVTLGELEKDHWCDDISFFLRAQEAGYELYCDLDLPVGHMVTGVVTPKLMEDGTWFTVMQTTASTEGVQFPQHVPTEEEISKNLESIGVLR